MEANKKQSDLPFYVFVDVNLPPVVDEDNWHRWLSEIDKTMLDLQAEGYADPCPANIVFFHNDPSHYLINRQIGNDADRLWMKHYAAELPPVPHPPTDMCRRFMQAHRQRVAPPADFPDFN
jgi:hypothetical protein